MRFHFIAVLCGELYIHFIVGIWISCFLHTNNMLAVFQVVKFFLRF